MNVKDNKQAQVHLRHELEMLPDLTLLVSRDDQDDRIQILYGQPEKLFTSADARHLTELLSTSDKFIEGIASARDGVHYRTEITFNNRSCIFYFLTVNDNDAVSVLVYDVKKLSQIQNKMHTLSSALQQTDDLVMISDVNGAIEYVNPAFEKATGYHLSDIVGQKSSLLSSGKHNSEFYKRLWDTILSGHPFSDVFTNSRKDKSIYYEEKTISPVKNEQGKITHFVSTGKDISDRMRTQERLHYMAHHDALTNLPNRLLFNDRLRQAMARAKWHSRHIAIMFLDLDHFKEINDTLGHDVGDQLLIEVTRRLEGSVRAGDTVARFGGDEFAILLDDIASEKDISQLAKKLLDTLAPPFMINKNELYVSASIGVSIFPNDGDDVDSLLRTADLAMYRAKDLGRNTYQFYSDEMSARAFEHLTLETSLRHALRRNEFFLLYQPQYDVTQNKIVAVEALLRWQHPELGVVPPIKFINLLEETGLIVPVGEWALHTACRQAQQWHQAGFPDLNIAINLSSRQCNNPDFIKPIERILTDTQIDPDRIEVELTESMLMRNASKTISALNTLSHLGIRIAVDDFGTGYSSLNYLRRFPISTLKIDRSFIRDVTEDKDDAAIATAIIVMAQSLHLDVVAEGIETQEQLDFIRKQGCRLIQGNYISSAVSANAISKMLNAQNQ